MSLALIFPGQGSQSVGMLAAFAARSRLIRQCFDQASAQLGFDLWQLVAEGPAATLNATENTQPAMLVAGIATWRHWREMGGPEPVAVAGHSLGEFTALVCAQSLDFDAAVQLVRWRGQYMQRAVAEGAGAMAAILGIEETELEAVCAASAQGEVVEAVNFNSPGQIVIAGHRAAVERAIALARERGAKRALLLPVSVPAHSTLMRAAAAQLQARLDSIEIKAPVYRFISAVDACEYSDPVAIRALLVRQLASPVRWTETVRALLRGTTTLVECGPGKVLTGLNRRIERAANCLALEDPDSMTAALASLSPGATHA